VRTSSPEERMASLLPSSGKRTHSHLFLPFNTTPKEHERQGSADACRAYLEPIHKYVMMYVVKIFYRRPLCHWRISLYNDYAGAILYLKIEQ
jgi:hypothetical protein